MKALLTLALVASALTLSSCACKDGSCPVGFKKKACPTSCAKPCCAKKAADCKTCTR
jgi:hypothetical protein